MRNEPMKYSSGNHRAGKGRNTQRSFSVSLPTAEERAVQLKKMTAYCEYLRTTDSAALNNNTERLDKSHLELFGDTPLTVPSSFSASNDEYNQEEYDAWKRSYEERARKLDEQAAELGLPTLTEQPPAPKKPEYKTVILHQHSGAWHRIATLPGGIELELEINRNAAKMLNQIPIEPLPERGNGWWTARLTEKGYNVLTYSAYAEYEAEEQQRIDAVLHSLSRHNGDRSFMAAMAGRM